MPVLRYAARSDVGLVRQGNEDSGYAGPRLLLVADGMGGHAAGELASAIAVATVANLDLDDVDQSEVLASLASSIDDVGTTISETIALETDLTGMGTTVTGMYWLGGRIAIVHVGDSRAYLLRDGELHQLTHDHTFVQTLVDSGRITEDEAAVHPRRSLLMRALDGLNPVEADLSVREARVGDRYMICTDGLSGVVRDSELAWILGTGDPTGCVTRLVDTALERGAPDNVTVVVADVVEGDVAPFGGVPVVVGAAGEPRVRQRLPRVRFPQDHQRDPDRADTTAPQPLIDSDIIVPAAEQARRDAAQASVAAAERTQRRRVRRGGGDCRRGDRGGTQWCARMARLPVVCGDQRQPGNGNRGDLSRCAGDPGRFPPVAGRYRFRSGCRCDARVRPGVGEQGDSGSGLHRRPADRE
jgi:protein phosphatase